jgi:hypothetical protein
VPSGHRRWEGAQQQTCDIPQLVVRTVGTGAARANSIGRATYHGLAGGTAQRGEIGATRAHSNRRATYHDWWHAQSGQRCSGGAQQQTSDGPRRGGTHRRRAGTGAAGAHSSGRATYRDRGCRAGRAQAQRGSTVTDERHTTVDGTTHGAHRRTEGEQQRTSDLPRLVVVRRSASTGAARAHSNRRATVCTGAERAQEQRIRTAVGDRHTTAGGTRRADLSAARAHSSGRGTAGWYTQAKSGHRRPRGTAQRGHRRSEGTQQPTSNVPQQAVRHRADIRAARAHSSEQAMEHSGGDTAQSGHRRSEGAQHQMSNIPQRGGRRRADISAARAHNSEQATYQSGGGAAREQRDAQQRAIHGPHRDGTAQSGHGRSEGAQQRAIDLP